jgi:hypothetical protein
MLVTVDGLDTVYQSRTSLQTFDDAQKNLPRNTKNKETSQTRINFTLGWFARWGAASYI